MLIAFQGQQDLRAARLDLHCPHNTDKMHYKLSWLPVQTKQLPQVNLNYIWILRTPARKIGIV